MDLTDGHQTEQLFDSFAADLIEDPYPHYDRIRSAEPVYWDPVLRLWVLTQYEHILEVLKNDLFEVTNPSGIIAEFGRKMQKDYTPLITATDSLLFFATGERHKLGRRTLSRALTNIPLTQLRPVIDGIAKSLADRLSDKDEFDAVRDYAEMFSALVMTHILGLPAPDAPVLLELARDFPRVFDMVPPSVYDQLNKKVAVAIDQLSKRITHPAPDGDRTGLLLIYEAAPSDGEAKVAAAATLAFTLFMVGTETTSSLTASCINTLLQQPELYRRARDNPGLAARIVSEVTRLESPVQRGFRVALEDQVIGGKTIRRNDRLMLLFGAANRDPSVFSRPAELDLERYGREDIAFGAGTHTCLGKSLAKLEAEIAVEQFLKIPQLARSGPPQRWQLGKSVRRFSRLPVRFEGYRDA